ncbi:histidine kinase [Bordetella genomosp. 10]|uniref:Histidine kinase n=2 Tax=Bordetella genomosp. 10 TaxID=1416804 RepID=A0A261SIE3_9BORD|nr:histidine kinase [Bordetella genomosp. 10]
MGRPASASPTPDAADTIAEQAAAWIVLLTDDDEATRKQACLEFESWKQADPRHAAEANQLERIIDQLRGVRDAANGNPRPARAAIDAVVANKRKRRRIKHAGVALLAALVIGAPAWMAMRAWPPGYLMADIRTATGKWETRLLADGTRITLDSASAVNLRYDARRRTIELVQGEILVDVAKDANRPFVVETAHGSIRALGTRFVVDKEDDDTILSMIESRVAVQTAEQRAAGSAASTEVAAGQRVRITADAVGPAESVDTRSLSDTWKYHQLVVEGRPLNEVLDELARYRTGHIHYDRAQIERFKVSAVLPLDDPDRALQLLQANFPALRIRTLSPWLVWVDAPPAQ